MSATGMNTVGKVINLKREADDLALKSAYSQLTAACGNEETPNYNGNMPLVSCFSCVSNVILIVREENGVIERWTMAG